MVVSICEKVCGMDCIKKHTPCRPCVTKVYITVVDRPNRDAKMQTSSVRSSSFWYQLLTFVSEKTLARPRPFEEDLYSLEDDATEKQSIAVSIKENDIMQ